MSRIRDLLRRRPRRTAFVLSGGGNLGWSETFVNTFTGVASCVDNVLPNSGTNPVTTTCSPFSMHRDGFMSFFGVDVDMTITE